MSDSTKKILKITSGAAIAIGTAGFIILGGTEAEAAGILSAAVVAIGGITALITAIKG